MNTPQAFAALLADLRALPASGGGAAETPEEIALAIAAEMLAIANGHDGGLLSRHQRPIHR